VAARRVPTVVTVQSHAFRLAEALEGVDPPSVTAIDVPASNSGAVRVVSAYDPERVPIKLEAAPVIVAGGRGIGDADLFASLSELADLLGGAVAATGAAIDEGWALTEQKIGLTGSVVSPELYVAVGVSGASQHLVGFSSARRIVAINTDRSAPIFKIADIGAVIDAGEAIPGLIALLKERSDAIDPAIDR
jgi:electron transfer flavoprotein alpha subunit